MKPMRLGIDLDGVVADFNQGWIERYNRDFGTTLSTDDIIEWDAPTLLTHFESMAPFWDWARTCGEGASLFRWLTPYPNSLMSLRRLAAGGHHIVILTTKPDFAVHDTFAWLADNAVATTEVHILDDKTTVDCDVYLDDADHNLASLARVHPEAVVCRYVRPWNEPHENTVDIGDWGDFEQLVNARAALRD